MKIITHKILALTMMANLAFSAAGLAAAETTVPPPAQFRNGDTVCFIGDSITRDGRYMSDIQLFYATRFPDRHMTFVNCGIGGDIAAGAINRLDWDILAHNPNRATIMLGMNDVMKGLYRQANPSEHTLKRRADALNDYTANMNTLITALKQEKIELNLIRPSIYDDTAELPKPADQGINKALAFCAEQVVKLATQHDCRVVDFYDIMTAVNARRQKKDPAWTIVGKDRIHPGATGHFVMAYAFLRAQNVPRHVSRLVIDYSDGKLVECENGRVQAMKLDPNGHVQFEWLAAALPFPGRAEFREALTLVPFVEEMNVEWFQVQALPEGDYTLAIDDEPVGVYSAKELAAGVNLAVNEKTPQYRQAVKVAELNNQRHNIESGTLRIIAMIEQRARKHGVEEVDNLAAVRASIEGFLQAHRDAWAIDIYKRQWQRYLEVKPKEEELKAEWRKTYEAMRKASRPRKHKYELNRQPEK